MHWSAHDCSPARSWNVKKTYEGVIEDLEGDITCIQGPPRLLSHASLFDPQCLRGPRSAHAETKITRAQIDKGMACMRAYDSFFSFYRKSVKGVHGTAIFTKRDVVVPRKAEEGIGSSLLPTTVPVDERIGGYPLSSDADLDYNTMKDLDAEGRTTVIDTGMFVLINLCVACPPLSAGRRPAFADFFPTFPEATAQTRPTRIASNSSSTSTEWSTAACVASFVQDEKSSSSATWCGPFSGPIARLSHHAEISLLLTAPQNICASDLDTAEPEKRARESGLEAFTDHPARRWLNDFTGENGVMIDITRRLHPERTGMFTCASWRTLSAA